MPVRYYLTTFDLENSKGREAEYAKVRRRLEFLVGKQNYLRIVKQCCIVQTSLNAAALRNSIRQVTGSQSNILVVRLRHGYSTAINDPSIRQKARDFLDQVPNT